MFRYFAITLAAALSFGVVGAQGVSQQRGQQVQSAVDRMMADPELSRLLNDPNLLDRIAQEAARQPPAPVQQVTQMDGGCAQGFAGVVDIFVGDPLHPQGAPPFTRSAVTGNPRPAWHPPAVSPGQARGWMLRFHYRVLERYVDGDPVWREWFEYESVVVLSPRSGDVGRRGAILALATDGQNHAVIDPNGNPSYKTYTIHTMERQAQMMQPFKIGSLQSRYVWRRDFGAQLPSPRGEIFLGYGLVDQRASQRQAQMAQARSIILPRKLAALDIQQEIAQEDPATGSRVMEITCAARFGGGVPRDVEMDRMRAETAHVMRDLCQNPDAQMAQMCARMQVLQQRALAQQALAQQAQRQQSGQVAQQSGANLAPPMARRQEAMRSVCKRRDVVGLINIQRQQAKLAAMDLEEKARVSFWEIMSAYESGLQRQTCWSVLLWQQETLIRD